jgi:hypothetical protein
MCWADKAGIIWGALFALILVSLLGWPESRYAMTWLQNYLLIAVVPWAMLRGIDWLWDGPAKRKGRITGRIVGYSVNRHSD